MVQNAKQGSGNKLPSRLGQVKTGFLTVPPRIVFYGPESIGKSSLAAASDEPIFFDLERGTMRLNVARYVFNDIDDGFAPSNFGEVIAGIDDLGMNDHPYKTLVIDTVDALEPLIWAHMLERDSGKVSAYNKKGKRMDNMEQYGWNKGYNLAVDEWRAFAARLDRLRLKRKMTIVLIGHSMIRTYKSPDTEDYDRFQLRIHPLAGGFLKEWADVVGFMRFEEVASSLDGDSRAKGVSTGRRLVNFQRVASYDAKSRIALPAELEMTLEDPWGPFANALAIGQSTSGDDIAKHIEVELRRIGDGELSKKVKAEVKKSRGDVSILSRYLAKLKAITPQSKEETSNV